MARGSVRVCRGGRGAHTRARWRQSGPAGCCNWGGGCRGGGAPHRNRRGWYRWCRAQAGAGSLAAVKWRGRPYAWLPAGVCTGGEPASRTGPGAPGHCGGGARGEAGCGRNRLVLLRWEAAVGGGWAPVSLRGRGWSGLEPAARAGRGGPRRHSGADPRPPRRVGSGAKREGLDAGACKVRDARQQQGVAVRAKGGGAGAQGGERPRNGRAGEQIKRRRRRNRPGATPGSEFGQSLGS